VPAVRPRVRIAIYAFLFAICAAVVFYLLYFTGPQCQDIFEENHVIENTEAVVLLLCLGSSLWAYLRSRRCGFSDRSLQALLVVFYALYISKEIDLPKRIFTVDIFSMAFYGRHPWPLWSKVPCAVLFLGLFFGGLYCLIRYRRSILKGLAHWKRSLASKLFIVALALAVLGQMFDMHVLNLPVPFKCDYEEAFEFLSVVLFAFSCVENVVTHAPASISEANT